MSTPIIFGVLLNNAEEKWLGRNQLMLALAEHTPVILLENPRFTGRLLEWKRPKAEKVRENLYILRNAFGFRYQKIGKRLGKLAAWLDGRWVHQALQEIGI